jgi:hypothetical protein
MKIASLDAATLGQKQPVARRFARFGLAIALTPLPAGRGGIPPESSRADRMIAFDLHKESPAKLSGLPVSPTAFPHSDLREERVRSPKTSAVTPVSAAAAEQ